MAERRRRRKAAAVGSGTGSAGGQQLSERRGRHGSGIVEALRLVAAGMAHLQPLNLGLHAFGNGLEAKLSGHGDGGLDDGSVGMVGGDIADE